jgi:hypothetical protein
MSSYTLPNEWNLWYHSIQSNDWTRKSYQKLISLKSLFDYQLILDTFQQNHYQNGMFFCMKKDVFPTWEDPLNREGSCLSFKIPSNKLIEEWNHLLFNCLNETILSEKNIDINGISISPKKEFNIIKIWFASDKEKEYKQWFQIKRDLYSLDKCIYKKHISS